MQNFLNLLKKIIGKKGTKWLRPMGHGLKGYLAALRYGFPATKLKIIGITGTKGKTTTSTITGRLANLFGIKTGYITTAVINTGTGEFLNPYKMTSIDSIATQKYLSEMVKNGCKLVVLEVSSQGLEQNRHWGIFGFDETMFLNIYPEHIEAHGSWENYKIAKGKLFTQLKSNGVFVANKEILESEEMWKRIPFNKAKTAKKLLIGYDNFEIIKQKKSLFKFIKIDKNIYKTNFTARFDILNCYFAITGITQLFSNQSSEIDKNIIKLTSLLKDVHGIPGRMEWVVKDGVIMNNEKKTLSTISVLVDYAHEPESMKQVLETLNEWKKDGFFEQIIHVVSCDGVGRDDWKKPILGEISSSFSDISILTTDNYEEGDDPNEIVGLLSKSLDESNKNKSYFTIINRELAFKKALELAKKSRKKTLIISTGVGSEQGLTQPKGKLKWDEREIWRKIASIK